MVFGGSSFVDPLVLKVLCMATCPCWVLGADGTDTQLLRCSGSFGLEGTVAAPFGLEGTVSDCAGVGSCWVLKVL